MSLTLLMGVSATFRPYAQAPADAGRKSDGQGYRVYGVAFYNLENLFDTINNNGRYDLEFSPKGGKKWDGHKYKNKLKNLATVISDLKTETTPLGPAIVGVSEVENKSVLDDLVATEPLRKLGMKVVHHDSPDLRGVDVGLLYNPRLFQVINVTNHRLNIEGQPNFKTRDQMCVVGLLEGSRVAVIVNHWPSRRGGAKSSYLREAAADLTKSIADSLHKIDPNMGVIVMGDLNDDPHFSLMRICNYNLSNSLCQYLCIILHKIFIFPQIFFSSFLLHGKRQNLFYHKWLGVFLFCTKPRSQIWYFY